MESKASQGFPFVLNHAMILRLTPKICISIQFKSTSDQSQSTAVHPDFLVLNSTSNIPSISVQSALPVHDVKTDLLPANVSFDCPSIHQDAKNDLSNAVQHHLFMNDINLCLKQNGTKILILGQRKIGKTRLLRHFENVFTTSQPTLRTFFIAFFYTF